MIFLVSFRLYLRYLLEEVVLGGLDVVPLGRPVLRRRADGLHLGLVASGLLINQSINQSIDQTFKKPI